MRCALARKHHTKAAFKLNMSGIARQNETKPSLLGSTPFAGSAGLLLIAASEARIIYTQNWAHLGQTRVKTGTNPDSPRELASINTTNCFDHDKPPHVQVRCRWIVQPNLKIRNCDLKLVASLTIKDDVSFFQRSQVKLNRGLHLFCHPKLIARDFCMDRVFILWEGLQDAICTFWKLTPLAFANKACHPRPNASEKHCFCIGTQVQGLRKCQFEDCLKPVVMIWTYQTSLATFNLPYKLFSEALVSAA